MTQPKINFFKRLVAMYGENSANRFYKEKIGHEPPKLEEEKEEGFMDLNNM